MIELPEGLYEVDQAYLVGESRQRVQLRDVTFEIFENKRGRKALKGRCFVRNFAFMELMQDNEKVHLALSFFDDYFLWLQEPMVQVGKVFDPDTESSLIFTIGKSIAFISQAEFESRTGLQEQPSPP
ncbi:MAG: hypothetical protein JRJ12_10770 [Deltaproteobacteria bacterium]|nr:hypothetical protein [Deltaproteobacteria bacterium]MBW2071966.1 hypothetical protein [Deltaproteobacteria bacterium]